MEKKCVKRCPFCGAELNGKKRENILLSEINELKEKGILQHTMYVAVKIVESMSNNNPAWLKETLNELGDSIKGSIQNKMAEETRLVLKYLMEIRGTPITMGKLQEEAIAKRLSSIKMGQDRFLTEKSRKSGEDVECLVIEKGKEIGKIVIESKNTRKWQGAYIEQIKGYMEREITKFGILATKTLPDDALNSTVWRDGVLVVKLDHVEPAYIFMREHLKLKKALEEEYSTKLSKLEVRDQILEELKKAITSGELDAIIERINNATLGIDNEVSKVENYLGRFFKNVRKNTNIIREFSGKLINDHIEKIRTQLIQQPTPPFSTL